ncbi:hypothetical protein NPX13_g1244 [Xylaria arbuscula]|uniref:Carrier domain-containing protein n=1 Tax=Xylaria arbuscula TaxID=114810 RepID=A0A9W8NME1_9PEZI|nr:hypothetical protein NPX13_g1244 [Xylaria arbuscula]
MAQVEPIAIIGMAFRFPGGAENPDKFWKMLMEKRCVATEYPRDRFNIEAFSHTNGKKPGTITAREGHFLDGDIKNFDSGFFSMAPHEVRAMDPQQRGLLENAYHAFENANLRMDELAGTRTSVHVGCFTSDFVTMQFRDDQSIPKYNAVGTAGSILANRISWAFDLRGESMYVDTACSSSLVALAIACKGLASGDADMAVVGGSNIILVPEFSISLSNMGFLSSNGRCNSFDAKGDGYGRGEGFATLILKPVSKAIADGNPIRALIRSIGTNQDGYTSGGITQPSKQMQAKLIRETYEKASLDMKHTRFFEAHGTGTAVGDPTEARAIGEAFFKHLSKTDPIYVGAVKSNIGHLEGTSGLAGVVKVIMALERGVIPPNTNFETLNPQIDADFLNLSFPMKAVPWPKTTEIRRASVNSFGFGGSNCHVVLDAADRYLHNLGHRHSGHILLSKLLSQPTSSLNGNSSPLNGQRNMSSDGRSLNGNIPEGSRNCLGDSPHPRLLILSSSDEDGTRRQIKSLSHSFSALNDHHTDFGLEQLDDVVFTMNIRRSMFEWKSFCVVESLTSFRTLSNSVSNPVRSSSKANHAAGLIFTGQGAQWPRMGYELLYWPISRTSLVSSQSYLRSLGCSWQLIDELHYDGVIDRHNSPEYSQAITTAVQIALVDLVNFLGLKYSVVVGHSSGEIAAAYAAGYLSHDSAIKVAYFRGLLASKLAKESQLRYGMASVGLSAEQCITELSQIQHNIQGTHDLSPITISFQFLGAMDDCLSRIPSGEAVKLLDRSHLQYVAAHGWLEIGPHSSLQGPLRQIFEAHKMSGTTYASLLVRNRPANVTILEAIGKLFCLGYELSLEQLCKVYESERRDRRIIVDLPQYPFNYSIVHWQESSRSQALRNRNHAPHPFLGTQSVDWNPQDARWCHIIKKDEIPWVSDHRLHGEMWYPASGMIVMAIEAVKQLLPPGKFDFELQDVSFTAPIIINEMTEGTETQISMRPVAKANNNKEWDYKFRIFCKRYTGTWDDVCDGSITALKFSNIPQNSEFQIDGSARQKAGEGFTSAKSSCESFISSSDMYRKVNEKIGLQYGPSFQGLANIRYNRKGRAYAELRSLQFDDMQPSVSYTIHPATLDAIFQLAIPALSQGLKTAMPTLVPSRVTKLWVSHTGAGIHSSDLKSCNEVVQTEARFLSKRSATCSSTALKQSDVQVTVKIEELELAQVARKDDVTTEESEARVICHELEWKIDPTLLNNEEMHEYCSKTGATTSEPKDWYTNVRLMLLAFIHRAFEDMKRSNEKPIPSMERYAKWLQGQIDGYGTAAASQPARAYPSLPSGERLQKLADEYTAGGYRGAVGVLIGQKLREILIGQVDPLEALFADPQYLANVYEEAIITGRSFQMVRRYIDALVHKNPGLRFLEVGAGTGAATSLVFQTIAEPGPRYAEYVFTDVSGYFLPLAEQRFKMHDQIDYRILDIEDDLETQGFTPETFDVVVAAHVLHATKDLVKTLSNVRKLLKPGGKLILIEFTTPGAVDTGFVWGSLPGWWLGAENFREQSAVVDESRWDTLLKTTGFSGTEQVFKDWDSETCHRWSTMVSSAVVDENLDGGHEKTHNTRQLAPSSTFLIVSNDAGDLELDIAGILQGSPDRLQQLGAPELVTLSQIDSVVDQLESKTCILLADITRPHLPDPDSSAFQSFQNIMLRARTIFWVQMYDNQSDTPPHWALMEGLSRVCRSENPFVKMVTLTFESSGDNLANRVVAHIAKVLRATSSNPDAAVESMLLEEQEYKEVAGLLCVNRLRHAKYLDEHVFNRTHSSVRYQNFVSSPPLKLDIQTPGLLDTIEWRPDTTTYAALPSDEVEIQVQAIGVNFKDCLTLLGRVNADTLGSDCAGLVTRVGKMVQHVKVGDRVAAGWLGTYQSFVRVPQSYVANIPNSMSMEEAAGVPTAFCTAYHSLYNVANLRKGETILIHAAAGGTGQAAVQIAMHIGANVLATVGAAAKRAFLVERYGIPEQHIFYSRDASFVDGVKRATQGKGVDVVLNSLSGKLLVASWEIIADFGRFVEIGRKDIDSRGHLPMFPFIKNAMFAGVDLAAMIDGTGTGKLSGTLQRIFDMMESGILRPSHPVQTFSFAQAHEGFRLLLSGKSTGKIVLTVGKDDIVPFRQGDDSDYRFSGDATYVIAGGLGGIGRQLARWMVRRGAINIILLTRSDPRKHPEKLRILSELEAQGINLCCRVCDIADFQSVREALEGAAQTMPPIRGCFQSAMVIQDRTFGAMNCQEWRQSVRPKVQGSWNLHAILPAGLDYFVMLSSAVCIFGNAGQGNYAAGNTFEDALARYRVARGEKAVAIDLGMVLDEGWLAERQGIQHRVMQFDHVLPLSQRELFTLFDYYCNPKTTFASPTASQVITGIELPAIIARAGREIPEVLYRPLFRAMHQIVPKGLDTTVTVTKNVHNFAGLIKEGVSLEAAGEAVAEALKAKLCKILGLDVQERTVNETMDSFGVDSLIALELRNWLAKEMRADLAVYEILGDVKLIDTGLAVARKSEFRQAHWEHVQP